MRHIRPVHWIRRQQPKSNIRTDLQHSIGSLLTICQLQRFGAARRLAAIAETGADPGPTEDELSTTTPPVTEGSIGETIQVIKSGVEANDTTTGTLRGTGGRSAASSPPPISPTDSVSSPNPSLRSKNANAACIAASRSIFLRRPLPPFLDQVRSVVRIRNRMMHFSPDPIPTDEWGAIDGLLAMLHAVDQA
ncbi:hypothetical protein ACIA5C_07690 [Actinoplanes sp. NPDC051343]|uniref:hypothetical protein n=1 Tax=Actinoplanes sp. NPDC051343 TaxID=3363906 RepID=UPI0037910EBD